MLQRNSTGKAGRGKLAAESARLFKVPAGDNAAEGVLGKSEDNPSPHWWGRKEAK